MTAGTQPPYYVVQLHEALTDQRAQSFALKTICESYLEFFGAYRLESEALVRSSFALLLASQYRGPSEANLVDVLETIKRTITRKAERGFWFNAIYQHYKVAVRPQRDLMWMQRFIHGRAVLDHGCDGGYLAVKLAQQGYAVTMADVLDYRVGEARTLSFVQMPDPCSLPFAAGAYDTAIVKTVLHHVQMSNLPLLLNELSRVAHRVVILEDTYAVQAEDAENFDTSYASQPHLREYLALTPDEQRHVLVLVDYFGNSIAGGIEEMNFPFAFQTPRSWKIMFETCGLHLQKSILDGYETGKMHKCCQVWMVFDH